MESYAYFSESKSATSSDHHPPGSLLDYGGKEAALLIASALAIAIIVDALTRLIRTVLHSCDSKTGKK